MNAHSANTAACNRLDGSNLETKVADIELIRLATTVRGSVTRRGTVDLPTMLVGRFVDQLSGRDRDDLACAAASRALAQAFSYKALSQLGWKLAID